MSTTLVGAGQNGVGDLSFGYVTGNKLTPEPARVAAENVVEVLEHAQYYSLVRYADGSVGSCGSNGYGDLGRYDYGKGNVASAYGFGRVPLLGFEEGRKNGHYGTASHIAVHGSGGCACLSSGALRIWGCSVAGELGNGRFQGDEQYPAPGEKAIDSGGIEPIPVYFDPGGKPYTSGTVTKRSNLLATLSGGVSGSKITSLPVNSLAQAISKKTPIKLFSPGHSQTLIVAAEAKIGDTSIAVNQFNPNFAYPAGAAVETAGWTPEDWKNHEEAQREREAKIAKGEGIEVKDVVELCGREHGYVFRKGDGSVWGTGEGFGLDLIYPGAKAYEHEGAEYPRWPRKMWAATDFPSPVIQMAVSHSNTIFLLADHTVRVTGDLVAGQRGDGTVPHTPEEEQQEVREPRKLWQPIFPAGVLIAEVEASEYSLCALDKEGNVYTWGENREHQQGNGEGGSTAPNVLTPTRILSNCVQITGCNCKRSGGKSGTPGIVGSNGFAALDASGQVRGWGEQGVGQLGDGTNQTKVRPTPCFNGYKAKHVLRGPAVTWIIVDPIPTPPPQIELIPGDHRFTVNWVNPPPIKGKYERIQVSWNRKNKDPEATDHPNHKFPEQRAFAKEGQSSMQITHYEDSSVGISGPLEPGRNYEITVEGDKAHGFQFGVCRTQGKPLSAKPKKHPTALSLPTIEGTPEQGQTLTVRAGSFDEEPTSYAYQWLRCDASGGKQQAIKGETTPTYVLTTADVGHTIRFQEIATNESGSSAPSISEHTAVVAAEKGQAPVSTSPPVVTGSPVQGELLTTSNGTWEGNPSVYAYQWQRCDASGSSCANIPGAEASTYRLTSEDVGHTVRSVVTASNATGATSAESGASAVILASTAELQFGELPNNAVVLTQPLNTSGTPISPAKRGVAVVAHAAYSAPMPSHVASIHPMSQALSTSAAIAEIEPEAEVITPEDTAPFYV